MTTESLLLLDAEVALRRQIDTALKAPLTSAALRLDALRPGVGTQTWVDCSLDRARTPISLWGLSGPLSFEYRRIAPQAFFEGVDKTVRVGLPVSAENAFRTFLRRWKIPLSGAEVESASASSFGAFTIVPSARSWRWMDPFELTLQLLTLDINDHVRAPIFTPTLDSDYSSAGIVPNLVEWLNTLPTNLLIDPLHVDMFEIVTIEEADRHSAADNTWMTLLFNGTPYVGELTIAYHRRAFEQSYQYPVAISYPTGSVRDLSAMLSERLGCVIEPEDLIDDPLPLTPLHYPERYLVRFDPQSLGYVGEIWIDYTRIPDWEE